MEEVLAKYFSEEASKDEISFVNSWKSESESNAKEFLEAKSIWLSTKTDNTNYQSILNGILDEEPRQKQLVWKSPVFKFAVAASILLALSVVFLFPSNSDFNYSSANLADGSKISLHSNSSYEILNFSQSVREVKVSGKAYFDIERDEKRPFIIHTDNAIVKVLGTSFVVDSYGNKTEVCVESGLVELIKNEGSEAFSVKLSKGEMGLVNNSNKGILKGENDNLNYLSWKTKVLTFDNASMANVAKTLEDVYGISVEIENANFSNCKLTAKFSKKKAKDALEIIARTFNIEYELSKNKAILKGKGC